MTMSAMPSHGNIPVAYPTSHTVAVRFRGPATENLDERTGTLRSMRGQQLFWTRMPLAGHNGAGEQHRAIDWSRALRSR